MTTRRPYNHWRSRLERVRRDPYAAVMHLVGDHTVGASSVPTMWRHGRLGETRDGQIAVSVENDAFAIGLRRYYRDGFGVEHDGNVYDLNRQEARQLVWWIVKWFAADWFGLRRRIYYWALTRHLDLSRPALRGDSR